MAATFSSCPHAHFVPNKYTGELILVPCGNCVFCRMAKAAILSARIEKECSYHSHNLFFTLTYDNNHIPYAQRFDTYLETCNDNYGTFGASDYDMLVDMAANLYPQVSYEDLYVIPGNDGNYIILDKDSFLGDDDIIPSVKDFDVPNTFGILSKREVQLFLKRLRRQIQYDTDNICSGLSSEERKFRYYICGEYGPTTFRPHYHGIFFTDNEILASAIKYYIYKAWPFCDQNRLDIQYIDGSASSYVSSYVSTNIHLPRILHNAFIKPFQLYSRKPSLGVSEKALSQAVEKIARGIITDDIQKINEDGSITFNSVRIPLQICDFLFPKCTRFQELRKSHVELYERYFPFGATSIELSKDIFRNSRAHYIAEYAQKDGTPGWYDENNILCARRAQKVCLDYGFTEHEYIDLLLKYHSLFELYSQKEFYTRLEDFYGHLPVEVSRYTQYAINNHGALELLNHIPKILRPADARVFFKSDLFDVEKNVYPSLKDIKALISHSSIYVHYPVIEEKLKTSLVLRDFGLTYDDIFSFYTLDTASSNLFLDVGRITSKLNVELCGKIQSERLLVISKYQSALVRKKQKQDPTFSRSIGRDYLL